MHTHKHTHSYIHTSNKHAHLYQELAQEGHFHGRGEGGGCRVRDGQGKRDGRTDLHRVQHDVSEARMVYSIMYVMYKRTSFPAGSSCRKVN